MVSIILSHVSKQYGGLHFCYPTSTLSIISLLIYNPLNGSLDDVVAQRVKDERKEKKPPRAVKEEGEGSEGNTGRDEGEVFLEGSAHISPS